MVDRRKAPAASDRGRPSERAGDRDRAPPARPGDWSCPGCGNNCFAWREACNRCGAPKAAAGGSRGRTPPRDRDRHGMPPGGAPYGDRRGAAPEPDRGRFDHAPPGGPRDGPGGRYAPPAAADGAGRFAGGYAPANGRGQGPGPGAAGPPPWQVNAAPAPAMGQGPPMGGPVGGPPGRPGGPGGAPGYGQAPPQQQMGPPGGGPYGMPPQQQQAPGQQPPRQYGAPPPQQYGAPPQQYGVPPQQQPPQYGAPPQQYGAPPQQYGAPQALPMPQMQAAPQQAGVQQLPPPGAQQRLGPGPQPVPGQYGGPQAVLQVVPQPAGAMAAPPRPQPLPQPGPGPAGVPQQRLPPPGQPLPQLQVQVQAAPYALGPVQGQGQGPGPGVGQQMQGQQAPGSGGPAKRPRSPAADPRGRGEGRRPSWDAPAGPAQHSGAGAAAGARGGQQALPAQQPPPGAARQGPGGGAGAGGAPQQQAMGAWGQQGPGVGGAGGMMGFGQQQAAGGQAPPSIQVGRLPQQQQQATPQQQQQQQQQQQAPAPGGFASGGSAIASLLQAIAPGGNMHTSYYPGGPGGAPAGDPGAGAGAGAGAVGIPSSAPPPALLTGVLAPGFAHAAGAAGAARQPPAATADLDLVRRASAAAAPADVLSLSRAAAASASPAPAAAALKRLGELAAAGQAPGHDAAAQGALAELVEAARARVTAFGPRQVADVSVALAQLELPPDVNMLDLLATQCLHKMQEATPEQTAATLSGFAKVGYIPATPLLSAAADAAAAALNRGPQGLGARDMAELMWALAKCEYRPPEALLQRVLQKFAQSLGMLPGQRISQLLWAFAQFGAAPPAAVLTSVMQSATAALATYPPDSMAQLLVALRSFGCALAGGPLLQAAAERALANMAGFGCRALADLLEVFALSRYHPGIDLLHAAAQQMSAQLASAEASGAPPPLPLRAAATVVRAYAGLAFAPPAALLNQLQALLLPQLPELEPADLAAVLWGYQLFRSLSPPLWNAACEALAGAPPGGAPAAALAQLFQAHLMVCKEPTFAAYETPPALIVAARGHWVSQQGSAAMLPPGEAQRDVMRVLSGMGVPHVAGVLGDDGLFSLKLALPDRRIAIEVLGPESFCVNAVGPQQQPQPLGDTVMRIQMLASYGWNPATIPHYEWGTLPSEAAKQQHLRTLLGLA